MVFFSSSETKRIEDGQNLSIWLWFCLSLSSLCLSLSLSVSLSLSLSLSLYLSIYLSISPSLSSSYTCTFFLSKREREGRRCGYN